MCLPSYKTFLRASIPLQITPSPLRACVTRLAMSNPLKSKSAHRSYAQAVQAFFAPGAGKGPPRSVEFFGRKVIQCQELVPIHRNDICNVQEAMQIWFIARGVRMKS